MNSKAIVARGKATLDVTLTEKAAWHWAKLADVASRFQADCRRSPGSAGGDPGQRHHYKIWQGKAELHLLDLEEIADLAKVLGKDINGEQIQAMLDQLRQAVRKPFQASGALLAVPEFSGPKIAGFLPPSLKDLVRGEKAKSGVDIVHAQAVRPELLSPQLAAALRQSGEPVVRRILQVIARPEFRNRGRDPGARSGMA